DRDPLLDLPEAPEAEADKADTIRLETSQPGQPKPRL
ncbi:MAG: hypothetical protein AVDCRST_MAG31-1096, partial [uncultured Sphingomonas sp.]